MITRAAFTATAQPASEPVTLAELRAQVRVDDGADDALLLGYLIAARQHVEAYLGRPILATPMRAEIEAWPESGALLLNAPVLAVTAVTITAPGADDAPWTEYLVRPGPGGMKYLRPAAGASWPALPDDAVVVITITAGWTVDLLPEDVRTVILQMAAHWFAVREVVNIGNVTSEIPETGKQLLRGKRWKLIG